jgi:hypothetical protein
MARKAVVSYALDDPPQVKRHRLFEGIRECACELRDLGVDRRDICDELEQVANDLERGDCDA